MDLQAILDSSDDSSSSDGDNVYRTGTRSAGGSSSLSPHSSSVRKRHTPRGGSASKYYGTGLGTPGNHNSNNDKNDEGDVDLEQILREDDDEEDDDNDDSVVDVNNEDEEDEDYCNGNGNYSRYRHYSEPARSSSSRMMSPTNPEEWDVLQAILGEDDDEEHADDDSDGPVMVKSFEASYSNYYYGGNRNSSHGNTFNHDSRSGQSKKVDLILQQSDDEDDELETTLFSSSPYRYSSVSKKISAYSDTKGLGSSELIPDLNNAHIDSFVTAAQSQESDQSYPKVNQSSTDDAVSPPKKEKEGNKSAALNTTSSASSELPKYVPSPFTSSSLAYKHSGQQDIKGATQGMTKKGHILATSDAESEKASQKALQLAKAQERKLLKSGHRDIVSPLMVKRRLKPKIELGTRMQIQHQQQNSSSAPYQDHSGSKLNIRNTVTTATHTAVTTSRFNFAGGIMNTKTMHSISKNLYDRCRSHQDLPTALGINSRFIAVGTQRGLILVFDLFEVLRQKLGGSSSPAVGDGSAHFNHKTAGSVTTLDLSLIHGEFLAAGYTSGNIVLWDTIKGVALKSVVETTNPSPIVSVRFLSDLKLVTVDASGLVNKLNFSKNMIWSTYSVESECLLDGTAGQILAMNVLPPYQYMKQQLPHDSSSTLTSTMKRLVLIALSSERSSFAVAVEPKVHVLHRWAKPEFERIVGPNKETNGPETCQVYLPCLSWGWALVNGGGHIINPILARAWGCCIQLLRAIFPDSDDGAQEVFQWPAFGVHDEFDADVPVVALEWLNDRSLIYLSVNNEFTVADTVMMTLLERLDFSGLRLVYAEFSLSRKVGNDSHAADDGGRLTPDTYYCTTFQNSFRCCDNRLLLLCQEELKSVSIVGARPRISNLENDGEWLEALALALDHYENTIRSQEDRRRDPNGFKDFSKHPSLRNEQKRTEEEEWIAKLLIRYLNIAVENAPETNNLEFSSEFQQSQMELATSHFQMLAGVCVEFCVVTKRLDLLFGPVFRRFVSSGFLNVFLDVLEPYILNDKLDYIGPEAMIHFVEHCRTNNGIATVERCLLHMDVTIMDFDSILTLLRAHKMYSALFYVYNQGLNDYTTPLEVLCEKIFDAADTLGHLTNDRRIDGVPQNDFEKYGYKAILYLQSCFRGRTFPQDVEMPEDRVYVMRSELIRFLIQETYSLSKGIKKKGQVIGQRALRYPYAHILLMVDPKAMLESIAFAMDAPDTEFSISGEQGGIESIGGWDVEVGAESRSITSSTDNNRPPERQDIISMLLSIFMPSKNDITITHQTTLYQSQTAVNAFLDFLAGYLMKGIVRADRTVTFLILKRMATRFASAGKFEERQQWQGQIISLLSALPRNSYDTNDVLDLMEKSGIHRASLLLHQEEASSWHQGRSDIERRSFHFCAAIDCYLYDDNIEFQKEVFNYVKKECTGASDETEPRALREALVAKLTDLVLLDPLLSAELAADLFVDDPDLVIRSLEDEEAKFMFLSAIISGDLNKMDSVAGSVLNAQLTMEHHHQYMSLMTKLHPELVYDYLSSHDNYRPEECLQLCQKYDIADASAYLLERMGNVTSALQLILQTMESRMMNLKRTIRGLGTDYFDNLHSRRTSKSYRHPRSEIVNPEVFGKQAKETEGVKRILIVALDVCERNSSSFSSRAETEHGSQLWFNVLDRLINAKGFLRLSKEQPAHAKVMAGILSELLRLTMQRMVSSVPLPDLVRKVTSDHSGSGLGELREMIESLLITYGLELDVFGGAASIFHYDTDQMEKSHHSLRIRGCHVNSIMSLPLDGSSASAIEEIRSQNEILHVGNSRNASMVARPGQRFKVSNGERGLGDALSLLRSRRISPCVTPAASTAQSFALNLMTAEEKTYLEGVTSPEATYFEERQVGQLGEAEHRGRIMSFMY